jgi:lipopolysaccharide/colanic/teichoic acid biosynthesis glycosyltransferase
MVAPRVKDAIKQGSAAMMLPQSPMNIAGAQMRNQEIAAPSYEFPDLLFSFYLRLVRRKPFYGMAKRGLDLALSALALALTLPLLIAVAILIKVTSPGPVFFKHRRLGRGGEEFWCVKFRTMVANAEQRLESDARLRQQFEAKYKIENDPRITPLGAALRRMSIDELPQLFQVLRGEMSLIGPRPIVKSELSKYGVYTHKLLSIKPGLSGLWQACRRDDTNYDERVRMDMFYIDHRCLTLDLLLIFYTLISVVRGRGAS